MKTQLRLCRICQEWFQPESPKDHCCTDCDDDIDGAVAKAKDVDDEEEE
jgi:hypothetical protein